MNEQATNQQKTEPRKGRQRSGQVVSAKMQKTCVVRVDRQVKHPLYGKFLRRSSKMHVHDEQNDAQAGDYVTICETRPRAKTKTWELVSVDKRANLVDQPSDA